MKVEMTIEDRNLKLKSLITCIKCKISSRKCDDNCETMYRAGNMGEIAENLEAISKILERQKTGQWLRMSDLKESVDKRYKCSNCGNVVRHDTSIELYFYNRYCGRCGSYNGRREDEKYE